MRNLGIASVLAFALVACSSSDTPPPAAIDSGTPADTAMTDSTPTDSTGTDSTVTDSTTTDTPSDSPGTCAFVGAWTMEKFMCDTTNITSSWKAIIPETTFVFSSAGGGCHVVLTNKNPSCTETEEFDWVIATDGKITSGKNVGITSCSPDKCIFTTGDAPCVVGDRAGSGDAGITGSGSVTKSGTKLVIDSTESGGLCGGKPQHMTLAPK